MKTTKIGYKIKRKYIFIHGATKYIPWARVSDKFTIIGHTKITIAF